MGSLLLSELLLLLLKKLLLLRQLLLLLLLHEKLGVATITLLGGMAGLLVRDGLGLAHVRRRLVRRSLARSTTDLARHGSLGLGKRLFLLLLEKRLLLHGHVRSLVSLVRGLVRVSGLRSGSRVGVGLVIVVTILGTVGAG